MEREHRPPPPPDGPGPFLWNEDAQEWRRMAAESHERIPRAAVCSCGHEVDRHERLIKTGTRPCRLCL